jgi:hypothetical protein
MLILYQVEITDPQQARTRRFLREADPWLLPILPSPGDAIVIDYGGGMASEVLPNGITQMWPAETYRLSAMRVVLRTFRPVDGGHVILHLDAADGFTHDPRPQIEALLHAGFREVSEPEVAQSHGE